MKKTIKKRQVIYRKMFDLNNDATLIDVMLFSLGSWAAFPLPKCSTQS